MVKDKSQPIISIPISIFLFALSSDAFPQSFTNSAEICIVTDSAGVEDAACTSTHSGIVAHSLMHECILRKETTTGLKVLDTDEYEEYINASTSTEVENVSHAYEPNASNEWCVLNKARYVDSNDDEYSGQSDALPSCEYPIIN